VLTQAAVGPEIAFDVAGRDTPGAAAREAPQADALCGATQLRVALMARADTTVHDRRERQCRNSRRNLFLSLAGEKPAFPRRPTSGPTFDPPMRVRRCRGAPTGVTEAGLNIPDSVQSATVAVARPPPPGADVDGRGAHACQLYLSAYALQGAGEGSRGVWRYCAPDERTRLAEQGTASRQFT